MQSRCAITDGRSLALLVLAGAALANAGCLAVAAVGAVAAGGAAGYAYYKGGLYKDYPAGFEPTWAATQAALTDVGLPLQQIHRADNRGDLESRTSDDHPVDVWVEALAGETPRTRVSVRVGVFGDQALSERFLDQIQARLAGTGTPAGSFAPAPLPAQTAPPPLAVGPAQ